MRTEVSNGFKTGAWGCVYSALSLRVLLSGGFWCPITDTFAFSLAMMMGDLSQDFSFYVLFLLYFTDWSLYCYLVPVGGAGGAVTSANLPLSCWWAVSSCPCVLVETAKTHLATLEGVVALYPCMADMFFFLAPFCCTNSVLDCCTGQSPGKGTERSVLLGSLRATKWLFYWLVSRRGEGGVAKSKPCSLTVGWVSVGGGRLTWHVGEEFATWWQ